MKNLYDYERTQSATTDLPFGALKNESSPGKQDGTDIVAEHIQDLAYSLYQVLQLAGINPNGELEDGNNKTQFIESLTNIGVFRYSDKTSYNYGVFAWQVIGNTFTLYRSLKNSNSDDVNNSESWLKILEIGADNKINFNVDTNILGLSANPSLSNLSDVGEDRLNVSKMYKTGAVSNDTKGFEIVNKLAHSTFDKSKFEVVGSPNITDDGIASGFSVSDCIYTNVFLNFSNFNAWELTFKVYVTDSTNNQILFWLRPEGNANLNTNQSYINQNKTIMWNLYVTPSDGGAGRLFSYTTNFTLTENSTYFLKYKFTGTQYLIGYSTDNENYIWETAQTSTTRCGASGYVQMGLKYNAFPFLSSFDLKQFSITVDGVVVFNGNKTGLYIAKSDNYEVVGSPTISEDGILSNVSRANNVNTGLLRSDLFSKSFYMITPFVLSLNNIDGVNVHLLHWDISAGGSNGSIRLSSNPTMGTYTCNWQIKTSEGVLRLSYSTNSVDKLLGCYMAIFDKATLTYSFYHSFDGINYELVDTATRQSTPQYSSGSENIYMCRGDLGVTYNASFDLNTCKFGTDGNLVYQPCLKIPYTESKTGSKIVDVAYRDRVQDLYEQTGEALFYTLDEENQNFTLPMSDIYGMITKNREILDIVYPIGRPTPEENNVLLDNEVWLEGATVNIVDYPKLFKVYGTKYGGDGITTFVLPDMRGRVLWGSPDGSNGYIEAKLPNIKGSFDGVEGNGTPEGCFYPTEILAINRAASGQGDYKVGFNASLSNPIYSDDATTVQPPAFKVRWKTRFE